MKREIGFYLIIISLSWIFCSEIFASEISYDPDAKEYMFSEQMLGMSRYALKSSGYDVNDINDIYRAAILDGESIREYAIWFLAIKTGTDSIPILKQALNDSDPMIRCRAARLLGFLGDNSGLERMRKDLEELSQGGAEKITKELITAHPEWPSPVILKSSRIRCALQAAKVLAEFGDTSGFKLAAQYAIEGKSTGHRRDATSTLLELTRLDKNILEAKSVFPEIVLMDIIDKEEYPNIIRDIIIKSQFGMNSDTAEKVLKKINQSPRFSPELRQKAEQGIKKLKKRVERENILKENEIIRK